MSLLSIKDFESKEFDPELSRFDILVEVSNVAFKKFKQEKLMKQASNIKNQMDTTSKKKPNLEADREFEAAEAYPVGPLMVSKQESCITHEAFKIEPKKERCNGQKFINSAIESLRKNALQRNCQCQSKNDDDDDDDWGSEFELQKKMMFKNKNVKKGKELKTLKKVVPSGSPCSPTQPLPEEFKKKIDSLGGTKVGLVIEKYLFPTDVSQLGNRMSMPVNQIKSNFLEDDETEMLESGATLTVPLIEPSLEQGPICLRQWNMDKAQGKKSSKMYVLRTQWGEVARRNGLRNSDVIQVWSFRANKGKLHLALVLVKRGENQNSDNSGGSECKSSVVDGEHVVEKRRGNNGFEDHPSTTSQSSRSRN